MPASIPGSEFNRQGGSKFNRRRQIKISLGALSPIEYRKSLGLAA